MTNGPIEFASDGPVDDKGPTEYGGRAGLVQSSVDGNGFVHVPAGGEVLGMVVRSDPALMIDPVTGFAVPDPSGMPVDRETGIEVDPSWVTDAGERPVEAPPRTGDPRAAEL